MWESDEYEDEMYIENMCPNCQNQYDEIDMEYQICHICGFNNTHIDI